MNTLLAESAPKTPLAISNFCIWNIAVRIFNLCVGRTRMRRKHSIKSLIGNHTALLETRIITGTPFVICRCHLIKICYHLTD